MPNRWFILFVLFFARFAMSFQFQSVAAVAPFLSDSFAASLADIGLLIGLYLAPGVIIAIPGGAVARRFGDRRVVSAGLVAMLLGGALIWLGPGWGTLVAGRILSGIGGIVVNVVMTKMVADWFAGKEIATAMAIFINSWPVGIGAALLILPSAAAFGGLGLAWAVTLGIPAAALALFGMFYRDASRHAAPAPVPATHALPVLALGMAGSVWALYNSAIAMVLSFGTALLVQQGWTPTAAGGVISAFILCIAASAPFGGMIADRTGRRDVVIAVSLAGFAALLVAAPAVPSTAVVWTLVLMGLVSGVAAGPIVSMPAQILRPEARVFGMGVFFAIYYGAMMVVPSLGGWLTDISGASGMPYFLGAAVTVAAAVALHLFRRTPARQPVPA